MERTLKKFILMVSLVVFALLVNPIYKQNVVVVKNYAYHEALPGIVNAISSEEEDDVVNSEVYLNDNFKGYLEISNTSFKEPLYQYSDNSYYLTHDGAGNYKISGATYIDYRVNNNSNKILIYSHNNDALSLPFSILENYSDYDYWEEHQYLTLTYDDEVLTYQIFSVYVETSNWDYMKLNYDYSHLLYLKNNSFYDTGVSVDENDRILILQTCSKDKNYKKYQYKYLLVIAKLI